MLHRDFFGCVERSCQGKDRLRVHSLEQCGMIKMVMMLFFKLYFLIQTVDFTEVLNHGFTHSDAYVVVQVQLVQGVFFAPLGGSVLTKRTKRAGAIGKVVVRMVAMAPCVESWCSGGVKRTSA